MLELPPLVLLPFVENAFKHGLSSQTGNCWLRIEVDYDGQELSLKVENSKPEEAAPASRKGGIGIDNVRKRLDILLEGAFEIKQMDNAYSYLVTLRLKPKKTVHETNRLQMEMPGSR